MDCQTLEVKFFIGKSWFSNNLFCSFLTYEFGPLCRRPEQWILLGEGLWAPVTCKDQYVGSRTLGCAFGPIEWSQRPRK